MNAITTLATALMLAVFASAAAYADPRGLWETEGGKSRVLIEYCDSGLCGRITWLRDSADSDGTDILDSKNADKTLRNRRLVGITLLSGFSETSRDMWTGGTIYNPEDGKTYAPRIELRSDDTLRVGGCVLFICKTQTWIRVDQDAASNSK